MVVRFGTRIVVDDLVRYHEDAHGPLYKVSGERERESARARAR